MTSQGTTLISFSTKFKKEAPLKANDIARCLCHKRQGNGLLWLDPSTKAKAKKSGWNKEEERPNTEADGACISLEPKKGSIGQMLDLSALGKAPGLSAHPPKESILDDVDAQAGGFSHGGTLQAYDKHGCPKSMEDKRSFGGVQDAGDHSVTPRCGEACKKAQ